MISETMVTVMVKSVNGGKIGDGAVKQMVRWSSSGKSFEVVREISFKFK